MLKLCVEPPYGCNRMESILLNFTGQQNPRRLSVGRCLVHIVLFAHYDLEPRFAISNDAKHLLVLGRGNIGHKYVDRFLDTFCLAADPINPTRPLFER